MKYVLRLNGDQSVQLKTFLFHDDNESAMLGLCGFSASQDRTLLLLHELIPVPHEICERTPNFMSWPTQFSEDVLRRAADQGLTVVKFHCHPSNFRQFSQTDDKSDAELFDYYNAYFDDDRPVGSFVMVPDGYIFGRVILPSREFVDVSQVSVIGETQHYYHPLLEKKELPGFMIRNQQTFGDLTTQILQRLRVGIIGCSGLGSATILELARSGIGELVLVDMDRIEVENLNRIFGASYDDIGKYKVDFFKEKLRQYGLDVKVTAINSDVTESAEALQELSFCDHLFGCPDAFLPRDVVNRLATYYTIGYTDLAIGLDSDGEGGIDSIVGWVRYLIPGGSSLFTRGMYDSRDLERESLAKENLVEFKKRQDEKYIKGAKEKSPPVISLNATVSSLAVTDFLNRIHEFKYKKGLGFSIDFCENKIESEKEYPVCSGLKPHVGRGNVTPFLNLYGLRNTEAA